MSNSVKSAAKFERELNRAAVRSAVASVFAAVITERKRAGGFTFVQLANRLGVGKAVVSRWFSRDTNWEINTIADIADALDIDLNITATDRNNGTTFAPSGKVLATRTFSGTLGAGGSSPTSTSATTGGQLRTIMTIAS